MGQSKEKARDQTETATIPVKRLSQEEERQEKIDIELSRERLEKKAKLYDAMLEKAAAGDISSDSDSGNESGFFDPEAYRIGNIHLLL